MAKYVFTGTITINGARSQKEATNELQVILDAYEDVNETEKSACIHWDKVEKVNE